MSQMYHIGLGSDLDCDLALLPGDPGRVEQIAAHLDKPHFLGQNREYTSWRGQIEGQNVLVMSTGMGGPSAAIGVEELIKLGVKRFIRIGTCGGMDLKVKAGDIVVASSAVRLEGTSRAYLPAGFPAVADYELTSALLAAARNLDLDHHLGVVHCKDSFYGQHQPESMPVGQELEEVWQACLKAHCLASEMESAALFAVCQVRGVQAGCVLQTIWNQERQKAGLEDPEYQGHNQAIEVAIEAVKLLNRKQDQDVDKR